MTRKILSVLIFIALSNPLLAAKIKGVITDVWIERVRIAFVVQDPDHSDHHHTFYLKPDDPLVPAVLTSVYMAKGAGMIVTALGGEPDEKGRLLFDKMLVQ